MFMFHLVFGLFLGWQHYAKDEFTNVVSTWSLDVAVSAFNLFELVNCVQWLMKLALFMYLILHPAYTDSKFSGELRKTKMFL
jgi:hypothetical protein